MFGHNHSHSISFQSNYFLAHYLITFGCFWQIFFRVMAFQQFYRMYMMARGFLIDWPLNSILIISDNALKTISMPKYLKQFVGGYYNTITQ